MRYEDWVKAFFDTTEEDPFKVHLSPEIYSLEPCEHLKHFVAAMDDEEIHRQYTETQIGSGLYLLLNYVCSNIPCAFIECKNEEMVVNSIYSLSGLYENYFSRYCCGQVDGIDNKLGSRIESLCFMFWDEFVVFPEERVGEIAVACLQVMDRALNSSNEQCQISAIHGLGHWVEQEPRARVLLKDFVQSGRSSNRVVVGYAKQAMSGVIQ